MVFGEKKSYAYLGAAEEWRLKKSRQTIGDNLCVLERLIQKVQQHLYVSGGLTQYRHNLAVVYTSVRT